MFDGYCRMGPRGRFYPCCYPWDYIGLFGIGLCRYCIWVELPVQRTPRFWGVTAWYQSIGRRIPRELGFGYPSPLGGLMRSIGIWKPIDRKFGLRPWKCKKNITTRCGLMLSLGMGLPRKGTEQN